MFSAYFVYAGLMKIVKPQLCLYNSEEFGLGGGVILLAMEFFHDRSTACSVRKKKKLPNNEDPRLLPSFRLLLPSPSVYSPSVQGNPVPSACSQPFGILQVHVRTVFMDKNWNRIKNIDYWANSAGSLHFFLFIFYF